MSARLRAPTTRPRRASSSRWSAAPRRSRRLAARSVNMPQSELLLGTSAGFGGSGSDRGIFIATQQGDELVLIVRGAGNRVDCVHTGLGLGPSLVCDLEEGVACSLRRKVGEGHDCVRTLPKLWLFDECGEAGSHTRTNAGIKQQKKPLLNALRV